MGSCNGRCGTHIHECLANEIGTVAYLGQSTEKPPRASLICLVSLFCLWFVSNEVSTIWDTSAVVSHISICKVVVVVMVVMVRVRRANEQTRRGTSTATEPRLRSVTSRV